MEIVRCSLELGKELSSEEHAAIAARIEAAGKRPYVDDPDCPLLTEEQLAEFHPVNGMTWEERNRLIKETEIPSQEPVLDTATNETSPF